jgi:hypothetical protein
VTETSGAEADDQLREAAAYNANIYLMVSMPYLLLGAVGVAVYRSKRQHGPGGAAQRPGGGQQPCPDIPPAEAS